jgi:osmotically-inducible protein OsmY
MPVHISRLVAVGIPPASIQDMTINPLRLTSAVACLSIMLSTSAPASAQPIVPDADTVETTIEQRWEKDGQLKACQGCDIDVSFENGVAVLTGEVPSTTLKARAERLARVRGVTNVDNRITVQEASSAADKARSGINKAIGKTGDFVNSAGEVVNDNWITTKIKSKFVGADELDGSSIEVATANHVVTLSGNVRSPAQRQAALRIARETDGVKNVVDELVVNGQQ